MSVSSAVLARPVLTREGLIFRAKALVFFGLAWHTVEAGGTLAAGIPASSSALVGFGADVTVETIGGLIVLWRFSRRPCAFRTRRADIAAFDRRLLLPARRLRRLRLEPDAPFGRAARPQPARHRDRR